MELGRGERVSSSVYEEVPMRWTAEPTDEITYPMCGTPEERERQDGLLVFLPSFIFISDGGGGERWAEAEGKRGGGGGGGGGGRI